MFDSIRKHTKVTMGFLFLLIVPSFVLFGLDGYNRSAESGATVAQVDGKKINQSEWDRAHQNEVARLRVSMPSLDVKLLDTPEARYATLERLVQERVIAAAAEKFKLSTSDQRLARELEKNSEISSLRQADGKLDMDRYRQLLSSQNLTPALFEANVRSDLSNQQVLLGIGASGFSSSVVADLALNAYSEKREIQLARFNAADFSAKLNPTDADLQQFYKANEKLFQASEQVNIEYVLLDLQTLEKGIALKEGDLRTYYEQNVQQLSGKEERRASHILITSPKTASTGEREKSKLKAQELLAVVVKSPDDFADIARKNSQDPGSAPNGGDLDYFTRGSMVKSFEDSAFSMKKGEVSGVVESEFGFHIIKLTDIKAPKQRSFDEMKAELEASLKKQQAQKKYSETAEAFTNGVYEQSDSLKPVAERLKLEIKSIKNVTRQPQSTGLLANPKFLNALFAPDAIEKKRNTEAIEIAPNQLVSGRILQYTPAQTQPFLDVKDTVRQRWMEQHGADEARKDGVAKLALWKASPSSATLTDPIVVSREQTQKLSPQVIDVILRIDASTLPAFTSVDLGSQGYVIVKILKALPQEAKTETAAKQAQIQHAQWWTSAESLAYYNGLKERFQTKILIAKPSSAKVNAEVGITQ